MKTTKYIKVILTIVFCVALSLLFVACGGKTKYTVTFDPGNGMSVVTQEVEEGKTSTAPQEIYKFGYKIIWKNGTEEWDFSTPIEQNVTLKAEWKEFIQIVDGVITGCVAADVPNELTIPSNITKTPRKPSRTEDFPESKLKIRTQLSLRRATVPITASKRISTELLTADSSFVTTMI